MEDWKHREENFEIARSLLILSQFDELCKLAEGLCEIVPLKGISLLRGLYHSNLDRAVGDIDLLIIPAENLGAYIDRLQQNGYELQFDFMRHKATRERKRKVALKSKAKHLAVDVDLHTAFVTKKFFSQSVKDFNRDALTRCTLAGNGIRQMDSTDEWLFLAQHATFHLFSDPKWLRDLDLLSRQMSSDEWQQLTERARHYGFLRIHYLTTVYLKSFGLNFQHPLPELCGGKLFRRFTESYFPNRVSVLTQKLTNLFWEFLFIDSTNARLRAYGQLLFPSLALLRNIYRVKKRIWAVLLYPLHLPLSLLAMLLFGAIYLCRTISPILILRGKN